MPEAGPAHTQDVVWGLGQGRACRPPERAVGRPLVHRRCPPPAGKAGARAREGAGCLSPALLPGEAQQGKVVLATQAPPGSSGPTRTPHRAPRSPACAARKGPFVHFSQITQFECAHDGPGTGQVSALHRKLGPMSRHRLDAAQWPPTLGFRFRGPTCHVS